MSDDATIRLGTDLRSTAFREALQQPEVIALVEAMLGGDCILPR